MKKKVFKKSFWLSVLSVVVLGVFAYFAIASLPGTGRQTKHLGNGVYKTAIYYSDKSSEVITGKQDKYGRWHGEITIEIEEDLEHTGTEKVTMVNGKRHGQSIVTMVNGTTSVYCYNMGKRVACEKSAKSAANDSTAFQIVKYKHPWFINTLNILGFSNEYIESYIDTVEVILNSKEFEIEDFTDNYYDVIEVLKETPYDSLIEINYMITLYKGLEEMKNAEFRLAGIDRYRADNLGTYQILQNTYTGYVSKLNEAEVSNDDLENFCMEFDAILDYYGPLDLADPYFIDSADSRIYRAIDSIWATDKSASIMSTLKSAILKGGNSNLTNLRNYTDPGLKEIIFEKNPQDVAAVVMISVYRYFGYADLIYSAVLDAYKIKKGIVTLPTVTTEYSGNSSVTSVTVAGYVIEDGGDNITDKGIVWGSIYDPTIDNNQETRGNGTLPFSATIEGLTEDETYFARAYATNSAGTGYGNCIRFVAGNTTGIDDSKVSELDFKIYPNPANSVVTFSFHSENIESYVAAIVDLNGKVIIRKELNNIQSGKNEVQINLTEVQSGIYSCRITNNKSIKMSRKLLIVQE